MAQLLPIEPTRSRQLAESGLTQNPNWGPQRQVDNEEEMSAAAFVGLVRRHWALILAIVALSIAAAYAVTRMTTPIYRASTTLYFADRQGSIPALDLLSQIENGNNEVATEMEVMRSRALAEKVVDSLGMQVTVTDATGTITSGYLRLVRADPFAPETQLQFSRHGTDDFDVKDVRTGSNAGRAAVGREFTFAKVTVELLSTAATSDAFEVQVRPRASAVDALLLALKVTRPNPTASVVQVSYTSPDPIETKNVPDVLANTYLVWRSTLRKSGDRSTVDFLRRQIDTIATQLYSAEESLRRFREANQVVDLPTQAQSEVQRLAVLEAQRADINMQRASLNRLMRDVKAAPSDPRLGSPYRRLMAFPGLMTSSNPALPLLQTLTDLERRRTELLVRRTTLDPEVQSLTQAITDVENQIAAVVDTYVKGLDEQATSLATVAAQFHTQVDRVPRREVEYARLDRTATGLTQIYTMLQTRLREAQIAEAVDDGAVRVVDPAAVPVEPIAPRPTVNLVLGTVAGLLFAFLAVLLRERLDHTIHTKEEAETISGAAVLALIPHIGEDDRAKYFEAWARIRRNPNTKGGSEGTTKIRTNDRLLLKDPQSVASEAFRKLRTNITFARADSPPRVLVFTSAAPGDGKTTTVMNLAIALVQQGKSVIVVDADMRRGGLHSMLNGTQTPGLSEILVGQASVDSSVQSLRLESFGTVDLLATGIIPPNPAELLTSPRFGELIQRLRAVYDVVLIDSPPINLVTDAAIIGRDTDGAVLLARAAKTTRGELAHAVAQLRQVQIPLTGVILNDYNAKRDAGYNTPYYYSYASDYRPYGSRP